MKTSTDPRHIHRKQIVQHLFAQIFDPLQTPSDIQEILPNLSLIDQKISTAAPEWPLAKINHIDLAILRLAGYEMLIAKKEPVKVIIDEAIELAKEFGSESSPAFINGALGAIAKSLEPSTITE